MIIDLERAREIGRVFKLLSPYASSFEKNDPQFQAVDRIVRARGCGQAALLVVANSLASYQLNVRGEEYWTVFAEYVSRSRDPPERILISFLSEEKSLARLVDQKVKRIHAFFKSDLGAELSVDGLKYCSLLDDLRSKLVVSLKTNEHSKTVLFAVKMYYYLCSACGAAAKGDVDIPIDSRNSRLSLWSCIARGCTENKDVCAEKLMRDPYRRELIKAWRIVCKEAGLPCVRLDSLTWLLTGVLVDSGLNPGVARSLVVEKFNVDIPFEVFEELLKCAGGSE